MNRRLLLLMRLATGLIWLYQGLYLKLIVVDPHHLAVVQTVGPVAGMSPRTFLTAIGAGETALGLAVLSGKLWRFVTVFQIVLLVAMNGIGIASGGVGDGLGLVMGNLPLLLCMLALRLHGPGRW